MDKVQEYKAKVEAKLQHYPQLVQLEEQTGVDKFYIFCAGTALAGILLFVFGGVQLVTNLVGFLYPAYRSFKAMQTSSQEDDTQWLTYWIVFSLYNMTEDLTDFLLSWIPFYYFFKLGFLIWCYHPATRGASVIYAQVVKPYIAPHVGAIDTALGAASDAVSAAKETHNEKSE